MALDNTPEVNPNLFKSKGHHGLLPSRGKLEQKLPDAIQEGIDLLTSYGVRIGDRTLEVTNSRYSLQESDGRTCAIVKLKKGGVSSSSSSATSQGYGQIPESPYNGRFEDYALI